MSKAANEIRNQIVKIIDEHGVFPSALDAAVEEQRKYYSRSAVAVFGSLDDGVPNHFDHNKRGFQPK